MKGNDSRRRREQRERVITIAVSIFSCVFVLYILGLVPHRATYNPRVRLGQQRLEALHSVSDTNAAKNALAHMKEKLGDKGGNKGGGGGLLLHMRQALEDPDSDPIATEHARQILSASTNLVNINIGEQSTIRDTSYKGVIAEFCTLDFTAQKDNPPEQPMFRDVVTHSGCDNRKQIIRVDLKEVIDLVKEYDEDNTDNNLPTLLDLKGVVFHESRCGSTLSTNSMMALNPQKHRVYSESSPPIAALRGCGEDYSDCTVEGGANLLKDVIYLKGRSNDPKEENLYFKFQSVTTRTMETFRTAFPTTPWIFLYREPIEVLMSQLDVPRGAQPNCVRSKQSSPMVRSFVKKSGYDYGDLVKEEFCAIHLATLCESALRNLEDAYGLGMAINYHKELVHDFLDTIFPKHFHTPVDADARDRVLKISGTYSKNRGQHAEGEFKSDSETKERNASDEVKDAAKAFLQPSFDKLQHSVHNIRQAEDGEDDET